MSSQVEVSTYFTVSAYWDPWWDVGIVFLKTLFEATWDICHCNVNHLSPGPRALITLLAPFPCSLNCFLVYELFTGVSLCQASSFSGVCHLYLAVWVIYFRIPSRVGYIMGDVTGSNT